MSSEPQGDADQGQLSPCPGCGKEIPQAWRVCLHCGFDRRTGAKRKTQVQQAEPPPALKEAEEVGEAPSPSAAEAEGGAGDEGTGPPEAQAPHRPRRAGRHISLESRRGRRRHLQFSISGREVLLLAVFGALSFLLYCVLYGTPSWLSGKPKPPVGAAYFDSGLEAQSEGNLREAIRLYSQAIELNPRFTQAYNNRGIARISLREMGAAIEDFSKAVAIDPRYAKPYVSWGGALALMGRRAEAEEKWAKAAELDPALKPQIEEMRKKLHGKE